MIVISVLLHLQIFCNNLIFPCIKNKTLILDYVKADYFILKRIIISFVFSLNMQTDNFFSL